VTFSKGIGYDNDILPNGIQKPVLVVLYYDPKLPNAVSKVLAIILGDIRPQLRQCYEPSLGLGLVAFVHFTRIIAGLTTTAACSVKGDLIVQAA
jgi:hypothetical protein